jgi:hypothetical protein
MRGRLELAVGGANGLQQWADKINGAIASSVASIIATGRAFIAAKKGPWPRKFRTAVRQSQRPRCRAGALYDWDGGPLHGDREQPCPLKSGP